MINNFDFISRKELIDAFADYCADLQINVFDVNEEKYGTMDLYLVKKIARLRTESVFVLKGSEVNEKYNQSLFQRMRDSEQVSDWRVFVTTPLGAIRIGYERLVKDMEEIGAWTYIIDPFHKRVLGATKGGKSKNMDKDLRDAFIEKLPSEPIRALSQVVKRSKYQWNEKEAYDPENIVPFYFVSKDGFKTEFEPTPPKYREIFRTLMIISKGSGLLMYKYNAGKDELDETLISGFLTAIDSFVNELSAGSGLNEIDYKNLKVIGTAGENVQLVAMLNDSPDKGFYERLEYLTQEFERDYADAIQTFIKKGLGSLDEDVIDNEVREILAV